MNHTFGARHFGMLKREENDRGVVDAVVVDEQAATRAAVLTQMSRACLPPRRARLTSSSTPMCANIHGIRIAFLVFGMHGVIRCPGALMAQ